MEPVYTAANTRPAYQLNWGLSIFWRDQPRPEATWLAELQAACEPDGCRILRYRSAGKQTSQFFVSTEPGVSPVQLVRSVKGRLQHLLREDSPKALRRNYWLRSIGSATRETVQQYVRTQQDHHQMADARVQQALGRYRMTDSEVRLEEQTITAHARHWYNLHLVLVSAGRWMEIDHGVLGRSFSMARRLAERHGFAVAELTFLADHLHVLLRPRASWTPEAVALCYLSNLAYVQDMRPVYQFGYYAGTCGEYDRGAVVAKS